ncbi:XrtA/PEP-CTERM system amidotransferase [Rhodocista pekingensis]|uniref:asparagine synthase (glutamine-hydrolyzing) n=1 Tax=Rhodocista pekingensis TaxID=201185 RepID=A0ABW2KYY4_9PROT
MCGIVGIFHRSGEAPVDRALLHRMNDSVAHRGPDAGTVHVAPGIGLGHRRLSIIDIAAGHQPLFNEDGSVCVVFNGEIYNFPDLIAELTAAGHVFRTRCDTEVIVHAWEEWGERCVERFRGMFAFALWDARDRTLFLARDRLGVKPLYYAELAGGTVLFGSELKALLCHPGLPRALDARAVEDYFAFGYVPDPRSIFQAVRKLPPAHTLTLRRDAPIPAPRRYWDVRFAATCTLTERDAAAELTERLREAIRIRLVSEVPLGAFLSGGVDSSAVVALMAGLEPGKPVDACSIGFDVAAYDELHHAEAVARRYGAAHHVQRVAADDFDLVDRLAGLYDEPFADSSAIPTYRVCALAKRHVTVALSGDGGDEVFAGYRRYRWHAAEERVRSRLPPSLRGPLFGLLGGLYPKLDWAPRPLRARTTLQALARDTADAYFHTVSVLPASVRGRLFARPFRAELQGYDAAEVIRGAMASAPADDPLAQVQYADLMTYLPGDILTKVDRASMAHALEVREPLLDHELLEWAATLPASLRLRGGEGKVLLKKAMEPYLPHDVMYRPKMGFAVPLAQWFRGPLRERMRAAVTGEVLADSGLFEMRTLRTLADEHLSGLSDHSAALWALVMFDGFLRRVGAAPAPALAAE